MRFNRTEPNRRLPGWKREARRRYRRWLRKNRGRPGFLTRTRRWLRSLGRRLRGLWPW